MKISTKGRYGLRVLIDLAERNTSEERETLRAISERQQITVKYLEQIMVPLLHAGYVRSYRGHSGGYVLSKASSEIYVGDVIRTMEGSLAPVSCLEANVDACPMANECPTRSLWEGLEKIIAAYLDQITVADLVDHTVAEYELVRIQENRA
ncbi:RrF2 family transcriptional regulator [Peptococcus niger]|uniref:Rrf2 family protein n=1 Tax=Peptococcus niger TaxID=2741 RepID=A0A1G6VKX6_PEPNI|nr:Rrf2 family transcriptional regulator [Peptococcus niger]SDD54053.1 Rrf2 family protein [Peptococcus niger]